MIPYLVKQKLTNVYGEKFILPDNVLHLSKPKEAWQGSEHSLQRAYFAWLSKYIVDDPFLSLIYAVPNGGKRGKIEAARLVAEGVKAGTPDVCIPIPNGNYHGAYIEFKKAGTRPSEDQRIKILQLLDLGYCCLVSNNLEVTQLWTKEYLGLK